MKTLRRAALTAALLGLTQAWAAPVIWTDWISGTAGAASAAGGAIDLGPAGADPSDIAVNYTGEIQFIQTAPATNY